MTRWLVAVAMLWAATAATADRGPALQFGFERQWPALQQPWYFIEPRCVAEDDTGAIYVADSRNDLVRKFSRDGTLITQWGGQGSGERDLSGPYCVALGPDGNVYVSDLRYIRVFDTDGRFLRRFGGFGGQCPGRFSSAGEIDFDRQGRLYVLDFLRVQRFEEGGRCLDDLPGYTVGGQLDPCQITLPNACVTQWDGSTTLGQAPFADPRGLAVDSLDQVWVADVDVDEVRQFDADGNHIRTVGGPGSMPGQFSAPVSVAAQGDEVYVADFSNNRIQVFDTAGTVLRTLPGAIQNTVENFNQPDSVSVNAAGELYVVDNSGDQLFRLAADGTVTALFSSASSAPGRLARPTGIAAAIDTTDPMMPERLFVADETNDRINVYELDGRLVRSFDTGINAAGALAVFADQLYVVNRFSFIDVFDLNGNLLDTFPDGPLPDPFGPTCPGALASPGAGLAVDAIGNVFVSDAFNNRVLKLDPNGTCLAQIGLGELAVPLGVAVDSANRLLVIDSDASNAIGRVAIFDADTGAFLDTFGERCSITPCAPGDFDAPVGIAVDAADRIYVSDASIPFAPQDVPQHAQVFDSGGNPVTGFGETGVGPGQMQSTRYLALDSTGRVYTTDFVLNRIEAYSPGLASLSTRVIVVAGGGPYAGNVLWPATQSNANFAFRAVATQGLTKDAVQYLSADLDLDLDQNGLADEVDAIASNAELELALLGPGGAGNDGFAGDPAIDHLVVYLIDHGGEDAFRMSGTELLADSELAGWLTTWQSAHPTARITLVYDACQSGSFLADLAAPGRTIITSAQGNENAYFVSQGTLSFSNFFWTGIFNGTSVKSAFDGAALATTTTFPAQTPLLTTDLINDGSADSPADLAEADLLRIGAGTDQFGAGPDVDDFTVTPIALRVDLPESNSATLTATGVADPDGIGRAWVVIQPPGFEPASPDNPVLDLPTVDLVDQGGGTFEAVHAGFNEAGRYVLTFYVTDTLGNAGLPLNEIVDAGDPRSRRAIVVTGGQPGDADFAARSLASEVAYRALDGQGYGPDSCPPMPQGVCHLVCDSVCYLSGDGLAGVDAAPTLSTLEAAITSWGVDPDGDVDPDVQDLTIHLAVESDGAGAYRLNDSEMLGTGQFAAWIETAQQLLPGTVTVVIDGDDALPFLEAVASATSGSQILIGSAGAGQSAVFLDGGEISFSKFFWNQVLNGARTGPAFSLARSAIAFGPASATPGLDDTGNGIANELFDGLVAGRYAIGAGIVLAGDDPIIGSISAPALIDGGGSYALTVADVTSTGQVDSVIAVVSRPGQVPQVQVLADGGAGSWSAVLTGLDGSGPEVPIAAYARDVEGNVSTPGLTRALGDIVFADGFD